MNFTPFQKTLAIALLLKFTLGTNLPAYAQNRAIAPLGNDPILLAQSRLRFRVPDVRASLNLQAAAARWKCRPDAQPITVIPVVPITRSEDYIHIYPATTLATHPQIFVHIPETNAQEADFSLVNEDRQQPIYQQRIRLPGRPGVVQFSIPETAPSLEVGQTYKWSMKLLCDPDDDRRNMMVEGIIQRLEASEDLSAIALLPDRDRPFAYAEADIWYDALSSLAQLRCSQPYHFLLALDWNDLLRSVNLDAIAQEPLVTCNPPANPTLTQQN